MDRWVYDALQFGNTCVVSRCGPIFLAEVCNKGIEDVLGSGDGVVLLILHVTDSPCLTTVDHFENMEEGWFHSIHFFMGVIVYE